jgi:hypothetical protein
MIPKPACVVPASPLVIQSFLHRAAAEMEVVALAACIIDGLSNRFALNWRRECPLTSGDPARADRHGFEEDLFPRPEIVALASLMLAAKVLDDRVRPFPRARYYHRLSEGGKFAVYPNDLLGPASL